MSTREQSILGLDMMGRLSSVRQFLSRFPLSVIQLGMRFGVGLVFFNAGMLKYNSFEFAVKLFEDEYKVPVLAPELAARLAMFNELTFSMLLFLGLGTRLATLPLLGMISVIQLFVYPTAWPDHLLWGSILIFLLTRGPGVLSVDYLIGRRRARQAASRSHPPDVPGAHRSFQALLRRVPPVLRSTVASSARHAAT
jgi:putative oxidoreductase